MTTRFGGFAEEYERFRPGYPEALWQTLSERIRPSASTRLADCRWLDVGSGTGRVAIEAAARFGTTRVIALEPDPLMLQEANRTAELRGVDLEFVVGPAEAIPLADASIDLLTVAQAFHWFRPERAVPELRRVLRSTGTLAVFWNVRQNHRSDFLGDYERLIDRYNPDRPRGGRVESVLDRLREHGSFAELSHESIAWDQTYTEESWLGFARTPSYVRSVLSAEQLDEFSDALRAIIRRHFGRGEFTIPYATELFCARAGSE